MSGRGGASCWASSAGVPARYARSVAAVRVSCSLSRACGVRGRPRGTGTRASTRPGGLDSTTTSSATKMASGMQCVTSTMVVPVRCQRSSSSALKRSRVKRIERAERLVEQQDLRLAHERARDRGALAHAARQLVRVGVGERGHADQLEQSARAVAALGTGDAGQLERKRDVVDGRAPRQQARLLENEADALVGVADRLAVDQDAARIGLDQAADQA